MATQNKEELSLNEARKLAIWELNEFLSCIDAAKTRLRSLLIDAYAPESQNFAELHGALVVSWDLRNDVKKHIEKLGGLIDSLTKNA